MADDYVALVAAMEQQVTPMFDGHLDDAIDKAFSRVLDLSEFKSLANRVGASIAAAIAVEILTGSIHIWAVSKYMHLRAKDFESDMRDS